MQAEKQNNVQLSPEGEVKSVGCTPRRGLKSIQYVLTYTLQAYVRKQ